MSASDYRISREAINDLNGIWKYTYEQWGITQADRYYNLIISEIKFIAAHPQSGKNVDFIREGYRSSKVNRHLIYYRISPQNIIEVIRILHEKMDIENRLR